MHLYNQVIIYFVQYFPYPQLIILFRNWNFLSNILRKFSFFLDSFFVDQDPGLVEPDYEPAGALLRTYDHFLHDHDGHHDPRLPDEKANDIFQIRKGKTET